MHYLGMCNSIVAFYKYNVEWRENVGKILYFWGYIYINFKIRQNLGVYTLALKKESGEVTLI